MRLNITGLQVDAVLRNAYPVLLLGIAVLSFLFSSTKGFVYGLDRDAFADNLMSSGSNDNLMIFSGAFLFLLPLICRLFRFKRSVNLFEDMLLCAALLVQALLLISVEVGSLYLTIAIEKNIVLALWVLLYALLWVWVMLRLGYRALRFIMGVAGDTV